MRFNVIPFFAWIIFIIAAAILLMIVFWAFFGYIPITIEGKGIIISQNGLSNIQAQVPGIVMDLHIKPGNDLKKGDILMKIYDPQIELKFKDAESKILNLKDQINSLKKETEKESLNQASALSGKVATLQSNIEKEKENIDSLRKNLEASKELLLKDSISSNDYYKIENNFIQKTIDLQKNQAQLASLKSQLNKDYKTEQLKNLQEQLLAEEENFNLLQESINQGIVYSPQNGKILEVLVSSGNFVKAGTPLVWIENSSDENQRFTIYGYFPIDMGKRIHTNTPIEMTVSTVNENAYGAIKGNVIDVSLFAISKENIYNKIRNHSLVDYLTSNSPAVIQVVIEPEYDKNHPDRLMWTSGKIPPVKVTTGTVGTIEATVEKIKPIFYLLPLPALKEY